MPLVFQRRIHRRHLLDIAAEGVQRRVELRTGKIHRALLHDLAVGVGGIGALPQLGDHPITLVGIEQVLRKLGRFAQTDRQHAGRQRIERAGMARPVGVVQAFYFLQRIVGRQTLRLVQQQHAVDITAAATRATH